MTLHFFLKMAVTLIFQQHYVLVKDIENLTYERSYFFLPRIYCKDGFNISLQINHSMYCSSENGYRKLGIDWKSVEWGFPSHIFKGSEEDDSVGNISLQEIEKVLDSHGGIDWEATFSDEVCKSILNL